MGTTAEPGDPSVWVAALDLPDDSEPRAAATWNTPYTQAADREAFLYARRPVLYFDSIAYSGGNAAVDQTVQTLAADTATNLALSSITVAIGDMLELNAELILRNSDVLVSGDAVFWIQEDATGTPVELLRGYKWLPSGIVTPYSCSMLYRHTVASAGVCNIGVRVYGIDGTSGGSFDTGVDFINVYEGTYLAARHYPYGNS